MLNPNKLFPRLSIQAKLTIGFVLIAAIPATLIALLATSTTVSSLRAASSTALDRDVDLAHERVVNAIEEVRKHVRFFAATVGLAALEGSVLAEPLDAIGREYLRTDSSAVFRFKVIDQDGVLRFSVSRGGPGEVDEPEEGPELFYTYVAQEEVGSPPFVVPIELRQQRESGESGVLPAVAVVTPLFDVDREFQGAVVAEALASALFRDLDAASPGLEGTTALVRGDGLFLYHSEKKRDWRSLLESDGSLELEAELGAEGAAKVLSRAAGQISTEGRLVDLRPLDVGGDASSPLVLYRSIPTTAVTDPVRRFVARAGLFSLAVLALVLVISFLAAQQLIRPIYRLRAAVRSLSTENVATDLEVETNDELEDLAKDFNVMSKTVVAARGQLEARVEAREGQLRATQAELADILTHSADAIISLDLDERIRVWNQAAERLFGYSAEEAVGRPEHELLTPPGHTAQEREFIEECLRDTGSVTNLKTTRRTRSGEEIPVSLTRSVIRGPSAERVGSSLVYRDERAQRQMDEHIRRAERVAAVSVMAAGLAHEINNPIAIMANRIELMITDAEASNGAGRLTSDLEVLKELADRLGTITGDLLSFARSDESDRGPVDLHPIVSRVTRLLQRSFRKERVHLDTQIPSVLPAVHGNIPALETLLVNLLMNALQAVGPGGRVAVEAVVVDNLLELVVADDGPGVPAEIRTRIFDPFFTTKEPGEGTGLGLTVCRTIVDRHNGTIRLENNEGGGARFVVLLPSMEARS